MEVSASFSTRSPRTLKFAPKVDEGFLLGYASNAHDYRVFNKTSGCVEIACDVTFDKSNGSQGEQVDNVVGMEESSSQAIKKLAIGEIKPQEQVDNDDDDVLMFKGHLPLHPLQNPETPDMKPETPDILTGVSGLLKLKHQSNIKISLKMVEMLNQSNINPPFHIQEFIT